MGLLVVGGKFLQTAQSNTDMMLNALATLFVLDIDEMVFSFLTPDFTRRLITELPDFWNVQQDQFYEDKLDESRLWHVWKGLDRWWPMLKLIISTMLVAVFFYNAPVCPHHPCDFEYAIRECPLFGFHAFAGME